MNGNGTPKSAISSLLSKTAQRQIHMQRYYLLTKPLIPPTEEQLLILTDRLRLEPILESHAKEMVVLLSEPKLYEFIPSEPPDLEKLKKTYRFWSQRISPEKDELWLNWVARNRESGNLVGHFQASFRGPQDSSLAYTVGLEHQRKGFAKEALSGILELMSSVLLVESVKAWIDTRNIASIELIKSLSFSKIGFIKDADSFKGSSSDENIYEAKRLSESGKRTTNSVPWSSAE